MARVVRLGKGERLLVIDSQVKKPGTATKRINIEGLNNSKQAALTALRHHVLNNFNSTYSGLLGTDPQSEAELLGELRRKGEIPEIKKQLRKARIRRAEFEQAVVDTLTDQRIWSLAQDKREDYAACIYDLFRRVRVRGPWR